MTQLARTASARAYLRQSTADLHRAVETGFSGLDLCDRDGYCAFLEAHAAALAPLEVSAGQAGATHLLAGWNERKRAVSAASNHARLAYA